MKIDTLEKILLSDAEYWILAKRNWVTNGISKTDLPDQIVFASIPHNRIQSREEIRLIDLENLNRLDLSTVHLNENYPPFQWGITLNDVYEAFPVTTNVREVFEECLTLKSDNIFDYKAIIDKHNEP